MVHVMVINAQHVFIKFREENTSVRAKTKDKLKESKEKKKERNIFKNYPISYSMKNIYSSQK